MPVFVLSNTSGVHCTFILTIIQHTHTHTHTATASCRQWAALLHGNGAQRTRQLKVLKAHCDMTKGYIRLLYHKPAYAHFFFYALHLLQYLWVDGGRYCTPHHITFPHLYLSSFSDFQNDRAVGILFLLLFLVIYIDDQTSCTSIIGLAFPSALVVRTLINTRRLSNITNIL